MWSAGPKFLAGASVHDPTSWKLPAELYNETDGISCIIPQISVCQPRSLFRARAQTRSKDSTRRNHHMASSTIRVPAQTPTAYPTRLPGPGGDNRLARRMLLRLEQKLQGLEEGAPLSVAGQVNLLIQQARDPHNLSRLFPGWQPYV
ncbi:hypothetical protein MRX96_000302 [Rhipicephalus microplus]